MAERWAVNQRGYMEGHVTVNGVRRMMKQHRWVAEQMLGRPLRVDEDIHHKNGIKTDNRPENLEVLSHSQHSKEHNMGRIHKCGYRMNLTDDERRARSERAKTMGLGHLGRTHLAALRESGAL